MFLYASSERAPYGLRFQIRIDRPTWSSRVNFSPPP